MNPLLLNREFKMPEDGWFHLVPLGEFTHPSGVVQVIDAKAAEAMVNRFNHEKSSPNFPGLLVDFDHFSDSQEQSSEAAGWVDDLANRKDGVWGHVRWSDSGEAAVKGGRYRLVSPVFNQRDAEVLPNAAPKTKKLRPIRLLKVAITNDPNLKGMVPLSNRHNPANPEDGQHQHQTKRTMKTIAQKLGLSEDASETSVLAEVVKLMNRAEQAEAKVIDLTQELTPLKNRVAELDAEQIDAELANRGVSAEKSKQLKPVLQNMKNRADRVTFLDEVIGKLPPSGAPSTPGTLHNRAGAKTPKVEHGADHVEDPKAKADKIEAEVQEYKLQNRCSYEQAYQTVRSRKPELFGHSRN